MPFSLAQLAAIEEAIASGALSVSYEGKSVTYASLDQLLRVRDIILRALGVIRQRSSTIIVAHERGFGSFGGSTDGGDVEDW